MLGLKLNHVSKRGPRRVITSYSRDRWFTHLPLDKMGTISQTIFSDAFSWMKIFFILIKISLKFVLKGPIENIPALVYIMAWRRIGNKPLSEPIQTRSTDAYMQHYGKMELRNIQPVPIFSMLSFKIFVRRERFGLGILIVCNSWLL